jgi:hypothetical protein
VSQAVPFWERALRYRKLSAEARAAALAARDIYTRESFTLLADGWQKLADAFSPSGLYWNQAPANENKGDAHIPIHRA